jgi:hypothetical protein
MNHPVFREALLADRERQIESNVRRARLTSRSEVPRREDIRVSLRLCTVHDESALEGLAALEGRSLPRGSFVVAEVDGNLVAAAPLDGGQPLADPFHATTHVLHLLRLRVQQIEPQHNRRGLFGRRWSAVRGY